MVECDKCGNDIINGDEYYCQEHGDICANCAKECEEDHDMGYAPSKKIKKKGEIMAKEKKTFDTDKVSGTVKVKAILPEFKQYRYVVFEHLGLTTKEYRSLQGGGAINIPKALWEAFSSILKIEKEK